MGGCAIECDKCGCLFIPGGRKETIICAGCYEEILNNLTGRENKAIAGARQIKAQAETLLAVQKLEYHDKNFLCNGKSCCSQQMEYLQNIMKLSSAMLGS